VALCIIQDVTSCSPSIQHCQLNASNGAIFPPSGKTITGKSFSLLKWGVRLPPGSKSAPRWRGLARRFLKLTIPAVDIARRQGAKSLELRVTLSLVRLWREQGKREEARQMSAQIYGWFTEGFETVDLTEAKALLTACTG
jgi:hypothetical protein